MNNENSMKESPTAHIQQIMTHLIPTRSLAQTLCLLLAVGCSSRIDVAKDNTGGKAGVGGGTSATGGSAATGGSDFTGTGGSLGTDGGALTTGGKEPTGGANTGGYGPISSSVGGTGYCIGSNCGTGGNHQGGNPSSYCCSTCAMVCPATGGANTGGYFTGTGGPISSSVGGTGYCIGCGTGGTGYCTGNNCGTGGNHQGGNPSTDWCGLAAGMCPATGGNPAGGSYSSSGAGGNPAGGSYNTNGVASYACTPGADQTCNDDPNASALWGHCVDGGDSSWCNCNDGYVVNWNTGKCNTQAGVSCYSPKQNLNLAYVDRAFGCACDSSKNSPFCGLDSSNLVVYLECTNGAWQSGSTGNCNTLPSPYCYSPSQNVDSGYEAYSTTSTAVGCSCNGSPSQCVSDSQGHKIGLVCTDGAWHSVIDGPCAPTPDASL